MSSCSPDPPSVRTVTNSQILIVGAMVVGPEYNAIMGIALGIDKQDTPPVVRGAFALLAGFTAAVIVTLIFGLAIRWSGHTPRAYLLGVRPVSSLIDNPNLYSLIVAVLAGIVGVVSLTEARAAALIGVSSPSPPSRQPPTPACRSHTRTGPRPGGQHCSCC